MANSRLKTLALKRILQAPNSSIRDEELIKLVIKEDKSAKTLAFVKFSQAISEIPLIEYKNKTFLLLRPAYKARCYFMMVMYLFGTSIASRWPEYKKLMSNVPTIALSHFVNSYCIQTVLQEKLSSYKAQMDILIDFVQKKGVGKEVIYEKVIMGHLVNYFPSISLNWTWMYNEIIKEPRPKNLTHTTLTIEKATSQIIKIVKRVAKDCDVEIQRVRQDSGVYQPSSPPNYSDVVAHKTADRGLTEDTFEVSEDYFPAIRGNNGQTLLYIEQITGAKVNLGKLRNGQSGVRVSGTKQQIQEALNQVLSLISENDKADERITAVKKQQQEKSKKQCTISYSTDILEKFIMSKKCLMALGKFSEEYPQTLIKFVPHKEKIILTGEDSDMVAEYLREVISDFALDVVSKTKKPVPAAKRDNSPDTPVTQYCTLGPEYNTWARQNKQTITDIALRNHVSLTFPTDNQTPISLSGKLKFVKAVDLAIVQRSKLKAVPEITSTSTGALKKKAMNGPDKNVPAKSPDTSSIGPDKSPDPTPIKSYTDLPLRSNIQDCIRSYGLDNPSKIHCSILPQLLSGGSILLNSFLTQDLFNAICIAILQHIDPTIKQTQCFITIKDKLLAVPILRTVEKMGKKLGIETLAIDSASQDLHSVPHLVCSTPQILKDSLDTKVFKSCDAKVVVLTDVQDTVGSFGYQILNKSYFGHIFTGNPKVIFQSTSMSDKAKKLLNSLAGETQVVDINKEHLDPSDVKLIPDKKVSSPDKITQTKLNNLSERQLEIAKKNMYLVHGVVKGYPDVKVITDEDIFLTGKLADINKAKSEIQDMVILHDKTDSREMKKAVPAQVITKIVSLAPQENIYIHAHKEFINEICEGYDIDIQYGKYDTDNISISGPAHTLQDAHTLISREIKSHMGLQKASLPSATQTAKSDKYIPKPLENQAQPPSVNQAQPPSVNQKQPPSVNQAQPPSVNQAQPPSVNQAQPPSVNQAQSPSVNQVQPPSVNQAQPPSVNQAQPPFVNQAQPPFVNQAQPPSVNHATNTSGLSRPVEADNGISDPNFILLEDDQNTVDQSETPDSKVPEMPSTRPPGSTSRPPGSTSRLPGSSNKPSNEQITSKEDNEPGPQHKLSRELDKYKPIMENTNNILTCQPSPTPSSIPARSSEAPPETAQPGPATRPPTVSSSTLPAPTRNATPPLSQSREPHIAPSRTPSSLYQSSRPPGSSKLPTTSKLPGDPRPLEPVSSQIIIPEIVPGLMDGSPEQWMFGRIRHRILSGGICVPLPDLINMFVSQFPAAANKGKDVLYPSFFKAIRAKPNIFTVKVVDLGGRKSIDVMLHPALIYRQPDVSQHKTPATEPRGVSISTAGTPSAPTTTPSEPSRQSVAPANLPATVNNRPHSNTSSRTNSPFNIPSNFTDFLLSSGDKADPTSTQNSDSPTTKNPIAPSTSSCDGIPSSGTAVHVDATKLPTSSDQAVPKHPQLQSNDNPETNYNAEGLSEPLSKPTENVVDYPSDKSAPTENVVEHLSDKLGSKTNHIAPEISSLEITLPDDAPVDQPEVSSERTVLKCHSPSPAKPQSEQTSQEENSESEQTSQEARPESEQISNAANPEPQQISQEATPESEQTSLEARPESEHTSLEATPESEQTSLEVRPESEQISNEGSPESEQTSQEASPESEQTSQEASPESGQTSQEESPESEQTSQEASPESEQTSQEASPESEPAVSHTEEAPSEQASSEPGSRDTVDLSGGPETVRSDHSTGSSYVHVETKSDISSGSVVVLGHGSVGAHDDDTFSDPPDDRTLYSTARRYINSVGQVTSGAARYVNLNLSQPGVVLVCGSDMVAKYSVIKHIVDIWVRKELPVFVVSPKLETVSTHPDLPFYQFKSLIGCSQDETMVTMCDEFLCSTDDLKLLVVNTSHKAVGDFMRRLAEEYFSYNVMIVTVALPDCADAATGLLSSWKRSKNDEVWNEIVEMHELDRDISLDKIKRGHMMALSLDGEETEPLYFAPLFGR